MGIFLGKRRIKLKKMKMKIFSFLYQIGINCKPWSQKLQFFSDHGNVVFILIYEKFPKI